MSQNLEAPVSPKSLIPVATLVSSDGSPTTDAPMAIPNTEISIVPPVPQASIPSPVPMLSTAFGKWSNKTRFLVFAAFSLVVAALLGGWLGVLFVGFLWAAIGIVRMCWLEQFCAEAIRYETSHRHVCQKEQPADIATPMASFDAQVQRPVPASTNQADKKAQAVQAVEAACAILVLVLLFGAWMGGCFG